MFQAITRADFPMPVYICNIYTYTIFSAICQVIANQRQGSETEPKNFSFRTKRKEKKEEEHQASDDKPNLCSTANMSVQRICNIH